MAVNDRARGILRLGDEKLHISRQADLVRLVLSIADLE